MEEDGGSGKRGEDICGNSGNQSRIPLESGRTGRCLIIRLAPAFDGMHASGKGIEDFASFGESPIARRLRIRNFMFGDWAAISIGQVRRVAILLACRLSRKFTNDGKDAKALLQMFTIEHLASVSVDELHSKDVDRNGIRRPTGASLAGGIKFRPRISVVPEVCPMCSIVKRCWLLTSNWYMPCGGETRSQGSHYEVRGAQCQDLELCSHMRLENIPETVAAVASFESRSLSMP